VLSDDGQGGDKHKMERFMQQGSSFLGSVYAPISYPPVPLLAFKVVPGSRHVRLAAAGALRSVDPDRLVIKKIVLSGTLGNEGVCGGESALS
jgi:pre-rRNA-processing protein TSR1